MKLAEIYIEHATLQLDQCFTYRCPDAEVLPGMRVRVPFGTQQLVGFVDSVREAGEEELAQLPYEVKEIQEIIDASPAAE